MGSLETTSCHGATQGTYSSETTHCHGATQGTYRGGMGSRETTHCHGATQGTYMGGWVHVRRPAAMEVHTVGCTIYILYGSHETTHFQLTYMPNFNT